MADNRKAIHAFLTPEAHDAWHEVGTEHGMSVSALIEALAQDWAGRSHDGEFDLPELEALAPSARKVDATRRRRGRTP